MSRRLRALRILHPFPSFLNAALVGLVAWVAEGDWQTIGLLSGAMLAMQFAIGVTNDIVDQDLDARAKPWRPIPSGLVPARAAKAIAAALIICGFVLAVVAGPVEAALWVAMMACGLCYDLWLKPTPWAWACYSVGFALLPIYAWFGAAGELPLLWQFLVALAVLCGPALQIANGLIDLESDAAAGLRTLVVVLGRRRSLVVMCVLLIVIHGVAWRSLAPLAPLPFIYLASASGLAAISAWLSSGPPAARRIGWTGQALSVVNLAAAWFLAVSA